ncbi:MAG: excisionase family DNA-binding protein [bacterium]|nr:excisionase family DNA-binding protein [bacterium]
MKEGLFLLTVDEVADILRVKQLAIFKMVYAGQIRSIRIGHRTLRFRKTEPYRYINEKESQKFYAKGMKFKNIGDLKNAVICFKDAGSIYPLNRFAQFELGKIYYDNINEDETYYDLAKRRFEKALELDFEDRNLHSYFAQMDIIPQRLNSYNPYQGDEELLTIKELARVIRVQYLKAYEMVVNDEIKGVYIGRWKIRRTEVFKYFDSQESEQLYKWGMLEKETGRIDNAINYFKEVTRIYPLHKDAHWQLAQIYLEIGKNDKLYQLWAMDRLKQALKFDPEDIEIYTKIKELEGGINNCCNYLPK